jgi:hypothetical protein
MKPSLQARGTLSDVAKAVGVSSATVSNAFNRPDQLSNQLRNKILGVARKLNYSGPNPAARMLSTGFANVIGVVYGEPIHFAFQDPADSAFVGGVAEACGKRGLGLLLLGGGPQSASMIRTAAVDGFIVYSIPKDDVALQAVADRGLPTVIVDQPVLPGIPNVGIDVRKSARNISGTLAIAILVLSLCSSIMTATVVSSIGHGWQVPHISSPASGFKAILRRSNRALTSRLLSGNVLKTTKRRDALPAKTCFGSNLGQRPFWP